MAEKIRILGIAPHESMRPKMEEIAQEYESVKLTVFVGDLEQGVEMARRNFYNDYDIIISRGGTALMLQEQLNIPVVEIPVSAVDIMQALSLAQNFSDEVAIVGYPNITKNAVPVCRFLQQKVDIYTVGPPGGANEQIPKVKASGIQTVICSAGAYAAALQSGMNVILVESGADSIRSAFEEAIRLYESHQDLREENRFLRNLLWEQMNHTVVFDEAGELFFSSLEDNTADIMDFLREESLRRDTDRQRTIIKQIRNVQYSIRANREQFAGLTYTVYYFSEKRIPVAGIRRGIRYLDQPQIEELYRSNIYRVTGISQRLQEAARQLQQTSQPIMIFSEDGIFETVAVYYMHLQSQQKHCPLIIVDCFAINAEKAWGYFLDHHSSPLAQNDCTIFLENVGALSPEHRSQLLGTMADMDICKRNRIICSCICPKGEMSTKAGMDIVNKLSCRIMQLLPLRQRAEDLPAMVNMYLSYLNSSLNQPVLGLETGAMKKLQEFDWPHNDKQLHRLLEELAANRVGMYVTEEDVERLLEREAAATSDQTPRESADGGLDLTLSLEQITREIIQRVMEEEGGNQSKTAMRLGISRTTLWRMLNRPQ